MMSNNVSALKKTLFGALFGAGIFVSYASGQQAVRPEFLTCDQPVLFFNAIKGGKYPTAMKFNPATTDFQTVMFGTYQDGDINLVKDASDLSTMIPIRSITKNIYAGIQFDKKYKGFRETTGGKLVESTFKTLGLMPSNGYKGLPLVDEYLAGCPMKVVVSNKAFLNGLVEYLDRCFKAKVIAPLATKPLMLLNVLDQSEDCSESRAFLAQYFELVDAQEAAVKEFFSNAQQAIYDAMDKTRDAKNVGESIGETLMGICEDKVKGVAKDFAAQELIKYLAISVAGVYVYNNYVTPKIDEQVDKHFKVDKTDKDGNVVKKKDADGKEHVVRILDAQKIKYAMIGGGASLAAFIVYCLATQDNQVNELAEIYNA